MNRKAMFIILIIVFLIPGIAGAVTDKDFEAKTTQNLVNLCSVSADDPMYHQAINFCRGYFVGAYAYYEAVSGGPEGVKLVCLPEPRPSRNEVIEMILEWLKSHPQYLKEPAVDTEFRFMMQKYPCK